MSNNISINPVTAKLLSGKLKLSEITLEQFREGRTIYNSYKEAKCKGYEAHHIVPVSIQNKDRNDPTLDNRCLRLTSFEHIIDHYLMAKELKGKYAYLFYCMINENLSKIDISEQELFNKCVEISKIKEKCRLIAGSHSIGNHYALGYHHTIETKQKISEANKKRKVTNQQKIKTSQSLTGHKVSEITKQKISDSHKGNKNPMYNRCHSENTKQKISESNKNNGHLLNKNISNLYKKYKTTINYQKNPIKWNEFQKLLKLKKLNLPPLND